MSNVIDGNFNQHNDCPAWLTAIAKKYDGIRIRRANGGNFWLEGTKVALPSGRDVDTDLGYMRTTGQWRLNEAARGGEEVEVYCSKTNRSGYVSVNLVSGIRLQDHL
jgi:hypothetical protein